MTEKTHYPLERVLLVRPQAIAAMGYVIAVRPRDSKRAVAVMAMTIPELERVVAKLCDQPLKHSEVRRVAMIQVADVTLDDEL